MKKRFALPALFFLLILLLAGCAPARTTPSGGNAGLDFAIKDIDGKTFDTRALRGKVTVINFWASWCGPCREEMPHFEEAVQKLGNGAAFIAIDAPGDMDAPAIKAFLRENGYTFRAVADSETDGIGKLYNISAIPATFFLDTAGRMYYMQSAKFTSADEILARVEEGRNRKQD